MTLKNKIEQKALSACNSIEQISLNYTVTYIYLMSLQWFWWSRLAVRVSSWFGSFTHLQWASMCKLEIDTSSEHWLTIKGYFGLAVLLTSDRDWEREEQERWIAESERDRLQKMKKCKRRERMTKYFSCLALTGWRLKIIVKMTAEREGERQKWGIKARR